MWRKLQQNISFIFHTLWPTTAENHNDVHNMLMIIRRENIIFQPWHLQMSFANTEHFLNILSFYFHGSFGTWYNPINKWSKFHPFGTWIIIFNMPQNVMLARSAIFFIRLFNKIFVNRKDNDILCCWKFYKESLTLRLWTNIVSSKIILSGRFYDQ